MFMSRKSQELNQEEREAMATREWEMAADYTTVLQLNRRYVRGELSSTPYHGDPLNEDTAPLRTHLLRFHDFGLLTISTQSFEQITDTEQYNGWRAGDPEPFPNGCSQYRQRPYVIFLLPCAEIDPKASEGFLSGLLEREEIYTCYYLPEDLKAIQGNLPSDSYPVTTTRQTTQLEGLSDAKWENVTIINAWLGAIWPSITDCDFHKKVAVAKPVEVTVAARSWDEDPGILGIVLQEAENAGMTSHFAEDSW